VGDTQRLKEQASAPDYTRHRFPPEVISHAVWRYFRFALSYRDVEELLAERGVVLTDETVRQWCRKFGQGYANALRRRRPRPGDKWHLDEVFIGINGVQHYLWRAVDQDGHGLDILVQRRRDKVAARKFFRRLLKDLAYVPRVVITDKLPSSGAARRAVLPSVEHRRHTGLNNRAENAHQPTRERERRMRRCKSPGHAQRFLAAYGPIAGHCRPRRHRLTAAAYRQTSAERCATWRAATGTPALARAATPSRLTTPPRTHSPRHATYLDSALGREAVACVVGSGRLFFHPLRIAHAARRKTSYLSWQCPPIDW